MANGVYIGMSARIAAARRLEIVSNNIANVDTTGFKQQRVTFDQFLVRTVAGETAEKGFTAVTGTVIDQTAGEMRKTDSPLDLAIDGPGFFTVQGDEGPLLTRAGDFRMTADGTLIDKSGRAVLGSDPDLGISPVVLRPDGGPVSVGSDGSVTQDGTLVAQIAVVTTEANNLTPVGNGTHFQAPAESITPVENPTVAAGHLEGSNVNAVRGMINLIEITNDERMSQKLMSESRKVDGRIMGVLSR